MSRKAFSLGGFLRLAKAPVLGVRHWFGRKAF
jgi:hypothetical protein